MKAEKESPYKALELFTKEVFTIDDVVEFSYGSITFYGNQVVIRLNSWPRNFPFLTVIC